MMPINVKLKTFTKRQQKMQKMFNLWLQRDLSLYGKNTIAKTLGLSKMIFSSACAPTPSHIVSSIDKMVTAFVWNNEPAKIKRESMIGLKESGGLDHPDYESIKKFSTSLLGMIDGKGQAWMAIPSSYLQNVGGTFIFECNYEVDLLDLNGLPEFYANILKAWSEIKSECIPENHLQIPDEILWNNKNITIAGKSIYYKDWHTVGIRKIEDLLNGENKFTSYQNLSQKVGKRFPFTKLLGLINAIPDSWKQKLKTQSRFNNDNDQHNTKVSLTTKVITCKQSCGIFIKRKFKETLPNNRLRMLGVNELDKINEIQSLV